MNLIYINNNVFNNIGILSSALLLGAIIGSFMSGVLISKYGERGTTILCDKVSIFLL